MCGEENRKRILIVFISLQFQQSHKTLPCLCRSTRYHRTSCPVPQSAPDQATLILSVQLPKNPLRMKKIQESIIPVSQSSQTGTLSSSAPTSHSFSASFRAFASISGLSCPVPDCPEASDNG